MQLFALEAYRSLRWMTHLFDVSRTYVLVSFDEHQVTFMLI